MREPAKVVGCFLKRLADDGQVHAAAFDFSDLSERHTFFSDTVVVCTCSAFFQSESEKTGGINAVHCGPTVEPVTNVG